MTQELRARAARALQLLAGIVLASAGVAAFDWRAGLVALGLGLAITAFVRSHR